MITVFIKQSALEDIINLKKIYEVRLNKLFFKSIKKNDIVLFKNSQKLTKCKIEEIYTFSNLDKLLKNIDFKYLNSRTKNINENKVLYNSLYSDKNINKYGLIVFKIKIIEN